jgi:hypothetical protein
MTIDLAKTISFLRPDEEWTLIGNDYSGLTWLSDTTKPTLEELEQAWSILAPEIPWEPIRKERDSFLVASDWTQLPDVSIPNRPAWVEYRRKLRDVTKDFPTPQDVIWPVPPA